MVAVKGAGLRRFTQSPPREIRGVLLYGSDRAQISAAGEAIAAAWRAGSEPAPDIIRLHETEITAAPERISVELLTVSLFGGTKILWLFAPPAAAHATIIEAANEMSDARLIVQAPDLKKSSKLVQAFENAPHLAAVSCYGEEEKDVRAAIRAQLASEGYEIEPDAVALLHEKVGNSQLAASAEIQKLIAYAGEARRITVDDVAATTDDQTEAGFDDVMGAALDGNAAAAVGHFSRFVASGSNTAALLSLLQARLLRLHALRAAVDAGEPPVMAVKKLRPPVFFKQQEALIRQCQALPASTLSEMIGKVADAVREGRTKPQLAEQIAERAILSVASRARRTDRAQPMRRAAS